MDDDRCKVCGAYLGEHYTVLSDEGYPIVGSYKDATNGRICSPSAQTTISTCGHKEELKVLRDIARLAGEWGIAIAELQVAPSPQRRTRAIEVARQMQAALQYYRQFQGEKN